MYLKSVDFVDDFGAHVNKYSYIGEHKEHLFCTRGLDHPLTSVSHTFKLSARWVIYINGTAGSTPKILYGTYDSRAAPKL